MELLEKNLFTGIERTAYLQKLRSFASTKHVVVITGARRSGKSVLLRQYAKSLLEKKISPTTLLFINCEDPRFAALDIAFLQKIYETYLEFLHPSQKPYLFIDEIHLVSRWEKWVRTMHELEKAKILVSGSNAHLLSEEFGTALTGRHLDITLFPLTFPEFLLFHGIQILDAISLLAKKIEIHHFLEQYIECGGFPETITSPEPREILVRYFDDILYRDIIQRYHIRKPDHIKILARYYLTAIGQLMTYTYLEKQFGFSADTIEKFTGYLENASLIFSLKRFSFKFKEQEKSPRKIYAVDTGLAHALGFRVSENRGSAIKNIVFLTLKQRQCIDINLELFYWKDEAHREVDFVLKQGLHVTHLIQVCSSVSHIKTKEREISSLTKALREFHLKQGFIITDDYEVEERHDGFRLIYIPLWKWLLEKDTLQLDPKKS